MKAWDKPEISAIDIKETAGGYFNSYDESPLDILFNDSKRRPEDNHS